MEGNSLYLLIAGVLMLVGLVGTVLPAIPGLPLIFGGMLLAAWADGFQRIGIPMLVLLGVLTLLSIGIDLLATALGAKRVGASRKAIIGAVLGTFAGLFVFPPFGLFLGPFAGAVAGELLHMRGSAQLGHAARVGFGTWVGILVGVALKLTLALAMIGLFLLAWRV